MKFLVQSLRVLIGALFIFSGLIKANDPLGLAYKMEEFFEIWHTLWLVPFSKWLSISMNALEIVSGMAVLVGWNSKWNLRLLLILILFFTGLTGYTYYTGFPKTCGCFGDCFPINSAVSFYKDLALLIGILILIFYQRLIKPIFPGKIAAYLTGASFLVALGLQYYVLNHLPLIDCLPYHVGQNIPEARKQPPPPPGAHVMVVYKKNGVEVEFPAVEFPDDFDTLTYKFIRSYNTIETPQPEIQGLILIGSTGNDTTDAILSSDRSLLIFSEEIPSSPEKWGKDWELVFELKKSKTTPIILVTNKPNNWSEVWRDKYPQVKVVGCDRTPIRTAARVNPTVYLIEKGIVRGKWALVDYAHKSIPN